MPTNIVITNAGRAALVNAQNTGTLPVVITQVGLSQTAVSPAATATSLAGEFKRMSGIGGEAIAPDTIHINMSDTTGDVYSLRSFALYLADGTLFGIYGQAAPMLEKVAASDALLAIDIVFADISAASLTFGNTNFLNPPATTERQGVVELATVAEAQAGIDALRALTPGAAKAAILGWLLAQDGSGSGLDADMLDGLHASAFARLTGANFTGDVNVVGAAGRAAAMNTNGDITANRGDNTGVYYFTATGTRYLYFNGAGFDLVGGQLAVNSAIVWNIGNDGSGSGLDADYLDGLDSTQFVRTNPTTMQTINGLLRSTNGSGRADIRPTGDIVAARGNGTGCVYLNLGEDRFLYWDGTNYFLPGGWLYTNGGYVWNSSNDGAGSGLDADLLDGYDSSAFARLGTSPSFIEVSGVRYYASANNDGQAYRVGDDAWIGDVNVPNGIRITGVQNPDRGYLLFGNGDSTALGRVGTGPLVWGGATIWHAGNDGAGSGLDADLLDGFQGNAFRRVVLRNLIENGGFYVYDDGLIEAWGYIDIYPNSGATFSLPTQHQQWVNPTISRMQSRYGDTLNTENIYLTSIDVDGFGRPASLTLWNSDNFTNRVFIQTKGY